MYGNNPKKLLNKIKIKRAIKMILFPKFFFIPSNVLNSWNSFIIIILNKKVYRLGRSQNLIGNNNNPKKVLIQFNERFIIDVEGSKIENKFVIIFINFCL